MSATATRARGPSYDKVPMSDRFPKKKPDGFSARAALRNAGVRARIEARETRDLGGRVFGPVLEPAGGAAIGFGQLLVYALGTIIALALLENALSGRGPAGAARVLEAFGAGIRKLVDPADPIIARGTVPAPASSPQATGAGSYAAPTGQKFGAGILDTLGRVIGLPGQGTHSFSEGPNNWQSDNAIDVAVPVGTGVRAPVAGVVVKAGYLPGHDAADTGQFAGQRVTIQGPGNSFYFAHLSEVDVKPGQKVQAGQLLGRSGKANGAAHLHFAVESGSPLDWLSKGGT